MSLSRMGLPFHMKPAIIQLIAPITIGILHSGLGLVGLLPLQTQVFIQRYIYQAFVFSGLTFIHPAGILLKILNSLGLIHEGSVASMYSF